MTGKAALFLRYTAINMDMRTHHRESLNFQGPTEKNRPVDICSPVSVREFRAQLGIVAREMFEERGRRMGEIRVQGEQGSSRISGGGAKA